MTVPFSKQLKHWQVYNPHDEAFDLVTQHPDAFLHKREWDVIRVPAKGYVDIPHCTYRARTLDDRWADEVKFVLNGGRGIGCKSGEEFVNRELARQAGKLSHFPIKKKVTG